MWSFARISRRQQYIFLLRLAAAISLRSLLITVFTTAQTNYTKVEIEPDSSLTGLKVCKKLYVVRLEWKYTYYPLGGSPVSFSLLL